MDGIRTSYSSKLYAMGLWDGWRYEICKLSGVVSVKILIDDRGNTAAEFKRKMTVNLMEGRNYTSMYYNFSEVEYISYMQ